MHFIQKFLKPIVSIRNEIKINYNNSKIDYVLFFLASILVVISIVFSYSLTIYTIEYYGYNQFHFFIRQSFVGILGIFLMWGIALFDATKILKFFGFTFFILFLFLIVVMPFLPSSLVTEAGGANRWIRLPGFSLSPIEFFKIGFIFFLAWSFNRKVVGEDKGKLKDEFVLLLPYFLTFSFVVFFVAVMQKDLGQVVLLGAILVTLMIFANRSFKLFLALGSVALIGLVGLIVAAPHRLQRIFSWWSMVQDGILSVLPSWADKYLRVEDLPEPYQVGHSLNAIHNGGFFGQGMALGDLKLGFLSEVHTDFVLAGITEEIGLVGISFIVMVLFLMIWRILSISLRVENNVFHLFCLGIALMIIVAFLINSYGISGMIPIKGIAVPFLSYGGSSMLAACIAIGLVLSISKEVKPKKKKRIK
ncbi:MAG: FtsW/RodA/SpoVE family cell cycle protein [Sulfurovum sp.]